MCTHVNFIPIICADSCTTTISTQNEILMFTHFSFLGLQCAIGRRQRNIKAIEIRKRKHDKQKNVQPRNFKESQKS